RPVVSASRIIKSVWVLAAFLKASRSRCASFQHDNAITVMDFGAPNSRACQANQLRAGRYYERLPNCVVKYAVTAARHAPTNRASLVVNRPESRTTALTGVYA